MASEGRRRVALTDKEKEYLIGIAGTTLKLSGKKLRDEILPKLRTLSGQERTEGMVKAFINRTRRTIAENKAQSWRPFEEMIAQGIEGLVKLMQEEAIENVALKVKVQKLEEQSGSGKNQKLREDLKKADQEIKQLKNLLRKAAGMGEIIEVMRKELEPRS